MTDRDQVAREATPVTVTVEGYSGSPVVREDGLWREADGCIWRDDESTGGAPLFARIASDALRIEELERENARLRDEADYSDGGVGYLNAVNHGTNQAVSVLADLLDNGRPARVAFGGEKLEALAKRLEALKRERDEARRLYAESEGELVRVVHERDEARRALALANDNTRLWRERVNGLGASTTEKGHVERSSTSAPAHTATSQGEGLGKITGAEQVAAEEPGDSRVTVEAAPAPIPHGAQRRWLLVVDAEGIAHECAEANEMEQALRDLQDVERTYHEKGRVVPVIEAVADAATVERVAEALFHDRKRVITITLDWSDLRDDLRKTHRIAARAALRALGYTIQEGA